MNDAFKPAQETSLPRPTSVQSDVPPSHPSPVVSPGDVDIRESSIDWSWLFVLAFPVALVSWPIMAGFFVDHFAMTTGSSDASYAQINGPLTQACQAYFVRNQKWPANLDVLLEKDATGAIYLEKRENLIDPWGIPYGYDSKGPHNQGLRPDIWTISPRGKVIGNWSKLNANPR